MTKREAYRVGRARGESAAAYCEAGADESCDHESTSSETGLCEDCLTGAAFESEQHARDFSPFEFTAHAINEGRNPEGQWATYDAGVAAGIKAGVAKRLAGKR